MKRYFVVTIDTEEDNWGAYRLPHYTAENIEIIPKLQNIFDKYGVRPTYMLSYPVATAERPIKILKEIVHTGRCEIGTHPHPWNNPPLEEERNRRNSMICNLPAELQYRKIKILHEKIQENISIKPISFRSGRWGFSNKVAKSIYKLGYKIDSSITPYTNWEYIYGPDYADCTPEPYWFSVEDVFQSIPGGEIFEIPATIGFLQKNYNLSKRLNKIVSVKIFRFLKCHSILRRLGILNKVWLSPEKSDEKTMIKLTENLMSEGQKIFNISFHSTSLLPGCSPFNKTTKDTNRIFKTIDQYLDYARGNDIEPIALSEVPRIYS